VSRSKAFTHSEAARRAQAEDQFRQIEQKFVDLVRQIDQARAEGVDYGYEQGYADGIKAGRRLAKKKSQFPKARGRQKTLHDIWALQFVDFVDQRVADGKALNAAVEMYRDAMARGLKAEGAFDSELLSCEVFKQEARKARGVLIDLYRRIKNGRHTIEVRNRDAYVAMKHSKSDT
jgi:hypothetical protein